MLLLHISDLHFKEGQYGRAMDPYSSIRRAILSDAREMCERLTQNPCMILITGDLAFGGKASEYEYATGWLDELCNNLNVKEENIFLVPGNHDVDRKVADGMVPQSLHNAIRKEAGGAKDQVVTDMLHESTAGQALYESIEEYNNFASRYCCELSPPENTRAKRGDQSLSDGTQINLWGVNTALISSSLDDNDEPLIVDTSYRNIVKEKGVENITLMHHPFGCLSNGGDLADHLKNHAKLQLWGHEHTNRITREREFVGISASAAHPDRQEAGWEPGYNLIEIDVSSNGENRYLNINAHLRIWQRRPDRFVAKIDVNGADVFRHEIVMERLESENVASCSPIVRKDEELTGKHEESSQFLASDSEMANLRKISLDFFRLSLSQKSEIAGKLGLLEDGDSNKQDFEKFRDVLIRAKKREVIEELNKEIEEIQGNTANDIGGDNE